MEDTLGVCFFPDLLGAALFAHALARARRTPYRRAMCLWHPFSVLALRLHLQVSHFPTKGGATFYYFLLYTPDSLGAKLTLAQSCHHHYHCPSPI
jgi:hypothetical protein